MDSEDFEPLKSKSQLGQDAMPCEDYVIVQGEDIIDIECCMLELLDMALGQRIEPTSSNLTAKPLHTLDVDERPPPIVRLADAQHHAQLLDTLGTGGALRCQVEHHVRDKKYTFSKLHHQNGSKFYQILTMSRCTQYLLHRKKW